MFVCLFSDTSVILIKNNLGVEVGVPLAVVFVLVVGVVVAVAVVMVLLTRRNRAQVYQLEQEHHLQLMASSNAYMMAEFENEMGSLKQLCVEYNYASLETVDELGEGAFGRVFKAIAPGLLDPGGVGDREGDRQHDFVAVKTLKEGADSDSMAAFIAEVKTSAQFGHGNVVRLLGICTDSPRKCMIFEYMDLGSLNDVLRVSDPSNPAHVPEKEVLKPGHFLSCCMQVCQGLAYLATLKFVHRDVATRNCLVDSNLVVKIADFGLSREIYTVDYYRVGGTNACLPVRWMPPEALLYGKFTVKSDVWSFGVLMWEVYSYARQPYGGMSNYEVIDRIKDGQVLPCPELSPASIYDIMKSCWTRVPQRRPTMASLVTRIGHLLRSNSMNDLDDYTTMGTAVGYLNLAFGITAEEEQLQEKARVDAILDEDTRRREKVIQELMAGEAERDKLPDHVGGDQDETTPPDATPTAAAVGESGLEEVVVNGAKHPVPWQETTRKIVRVYSVELLPSVSDNLGYPLSN